jgi:hypothetical protein
MKLQGKEAFIIKAVRARAGDVVQVAIAATAPPIEFTQSPSQGLPQVELTQLGQLATPPNGSSAHDGLPNRVQPRASASKPEAAKADDAVSRSLIMVIPPKLMAPAEQKQTREVVQPDQSWDEPGR